MLPAKLLAILLFVCKDIKAFSLKNCIVHNMNDHAMSMKVLCYKMNLKQVPKEIPEQVNNLDLSENQIRNLWIADFKCMSCLQVLNVSQNCINFIEQGTFTILGSLRVLNLSNNNLTVLFSNMFYGLTNLTVLHLGCNNIKWIESAAFANLTSLNTINLTLNKLLSMSSLKPVFRVEALKELHIAGNNLKIFSTEDIIQMSAVLEGLDISRNPFSVINITNDVFDDLVSLDVSFSGVNEYISWNINNASFLRGIKHLSLGGMSVTSSTILTIVKSLIKTSLESIQLNSLNLSSVDNVTAEICLRQTLLKVLNLQSNKYHTIKEGVFNNCLNLNHLDLEDNGLYEVDEDAFKGLTNLSYLSLAQNLLPTVPNATRQLSFLESLDLSFNCISEIKAQDFEHLGKLKYLNLTGNKIIKISSSLFKGLYSLIGMNLENNLLLDISELSNSLYKVEFLMLCRNKLSLIQKNTFINLVSLKILNLHDNQISDIEEGAFEGLKNLKILFLGSNKMKRNALEKDIFKGMTSLRQLQIFDNHLAYESSVPLKTPPFRHLKSLAFLSINSQHNGMQHIPINFLEGLDSLKEIHAGNLAIKYLDPKTFSYTPNLTFLDVSNNALKVVSKDMFLYLPDLIELHFNKIGIDSLDFFRNTSTLSNLKHLRVAGNQLNVIHEDQVIALPSIKFLDMRENPFSCSCDNSWFLKWSLLDNKTQVIYFYDYTCAYPPNFKGTKLPNFNASSCIFEFDFYLFLSSSSSVAIVIIVSSIYHFWRWHVFYAYYLFLASVYDKRQLKKPYMYKCKYDAFISYNRHDEDWVINKLLPNLEEYYHWKLCLHHRDFEPGKAILDNIVDNIYASRKTICVISHHYLESEWCSKEIQVASFRIFDDYKDVLILIFLEDLPVRILSPYHRMRKLLKKKTYLTWPKHVEENNLFWHRLNMALQTREQKEDDNPVIPHLLINETN
ncbi:toll-like receptor 13 [Protopterus annectens]|uniref:toll-like receptor 13 n=1 Tax=Protopterus annectens TaxID=7888 RepID=UPI001CF9BF7C|nr:toll-like receptor 13 [Protopterus annectens]